MKIIQRFYLTHNFGFYIITSLLWFHLILDLKTIVPGLVFAALDIFVAMTVWGKYREILKKE